MVRVDLRGDGRELPRQQVLDVQERSLTLPRWGLLAILVLGLALRLYGIHNPILDHPGWRQGDTAAIARNFATLDFNIFYPQTDYDGPRDNYVELELQIVPFIAAIGYKLFGVHEVFGRLISIAFSLGTVAVLYPFGKLLFGTPRAGLVAALLFAIFPGSVYYGRTFTPDTTMAFFLTAALYAAAAWLFRGDLTSWRRWWLPSVLMMLAVLAKPVALVGLVPVIWLMLRRAGVSQAVRAPQTWAYLVVAVVPYLAYDRFVASHAEWLWSSGITRLHVIPSFVHSLESLGALRLKLAFFALAIDMLAHTMVGPAGFGLAIAGIIVVAARRTLSGEFLVAWLLAGLAYAYVVVTVERVDYYLYPLVPLAALLGAAAAGEIASRLRAGPSPWLTGVAALVLVAVIADNAIQVAPYYVYRGTVYRAARALDKALPADAIVVMGHYDPSILYYINRKGWEEDPLLWTPFDEESAIKKGSRYFIAVEEPRLRKNAELFAWLQRFPVSKPEALWPVYNTDPARMMPGAEEKWQEFRRKEKAAL